MAPTGGTGGGPGGGGGGNIKVVVRVRPFNNREIDRSAKCIVQMQDAQTVLQPPPEAEDRLRKGGKDGSSAQRTFKFDKSYWSFDKADPNYAGQDNVFHDLGIPLLDNAFQGYNNCIFAYGQTGSGKSYSMMGYGEEAGVIPKICRDMFERIDGLQSDPNLTCTVEVSYLEIYNERVRDLLNPATKGNLRVREHPSTGPYVEDLAKLAVRSFIEIENLMDEGNKARTVAATNMNETSSRSHAVFTLTLTQKRHDTETNMDTEKVAKISLVDLAGSERATSTGATGARLKEGAEINRSLSTLGRVIAALADLSSGKKGMKVPYRDSVLTWLLKDSLGGNSLTAMIAAISPADINFEETLSTLRYADSAKRIKNHAVINEDPNARMIRELKEELAKLRSQLGGSAVAGGTEETYPEGTPLEKQMVSIIQSDGSIKRVSKAEIMEQLSQSEKLYSDLNQTWEQKLAKTEEIHKERESALEELGISIEKGNVGMSTPKKMPHLVNLSDDPLLAECLVYNLKPGITTVGNVEASEASEIRLNGSKILEHHCKLENVDNVVSVIPNEGAAVMVNGVRVDKTKRLKSGNRIILGDFHIFRFNNPLEAKAERAERSLLRHSITPSQLGSPTPTPFRPGHERTWSAAGSEWDGDSSRAQSPGLSSNRDSDWFFARREAAGALLGADPKITQLTDEELDNLFENIQRAREERRTRPDKILDHDEDSDDLSSFLVRDKYMSNGTVDNFLLDPGLTIPGSPSVSGSSQGEGEPTLTASQFAEQQQEQQKVDEEKRQAEETAAKEAEGAAQAARIQEELEQARQEFQEELRKQKDAYEAQIKKIDHDARIRDAARTPAGFLPLEASEIGIARNVVEKWQQRNYILVAEAILQNAGLLKEAQVMSKLMDQDCNFQFVILDSGEERGSSYDLILRDGDDDDALTNARKPCLAVRVINNQLSCIHLWSLDKLRERVAKMRQMHQYKDQPEYLQHFRLDNPFRDSDQPLFSLVGDGTIPLTAVFETRVQDFVVEISSPSTRQIIGKIRMSLEPSLAESPPTTIKFNIVIRDLAGFAEHEGTQVHAQMTVLGTEDESVATTQPIHGFGDGPVRFESIHNLSVRRSGETSAVLKIAIFAQVSSTHLDKLISWDELREMSEQQHDVQPTHRISEAEYNLEERHDVFAKVQFLELAENGQYMPVEVVQNNANDIGAFQLHQGLQRRISVNLTHVFTEGLPWDDLKNLRAGEVHLIDASGRVVDLGSITADIPLKQIQEPMIKDNADGTSNITIIGQWDSSLHKSLLLDRATQEGFRVQVSLRWDIISNRLGQDHPMPFSIEQQLQILPRSHVRPQPMFKSFWNQTRITHSADGLFSIVVRPVSAKRAADLWRLDTSKNYINGEEHLGNWQPRGLSLVKDYLIARRKRRQLQDIESAKAALGLRRLSVGKVQRARPASPSTTDPREEQLLRKFVAIWQKPSPEMQNPIFDDHDPTNPQPRPQPTAQTSPQSTRYQATVTHIAKNPTSMKSGYLLMPSETYDPSASQSATMQWKRRFVDLRPPYLHIHSVPDGEGINAINLTHARIDHDPDFKRLLGGGGSISSGDSAEPRTPTHRRAGSEISGLAHVFAVYGEQNTFLFAARSESQKVEWILKIDQSYFAGEGDGEGGAG
ncbi:hypothetical protein H2200_001258 [Cladophialophora chaetospira]|uniref:Kinesin family protein n=1 Tax=Cladophialophora chaetospira TaxID=386627 RepID=A0AA38XKJ7_9EURO|nr:hypothetical protein H2200_001258 [Cladophialophora chaetospira]